MTPHDPQAYFLPLLKFILNSDNFEMFLFAQMGHTLLCLCYSQDLLPPLKPLPTFIAWGPAVLVRREKLHQDVAYQPKKMSVKHEVMLKVALGRWREGALVHNLPTSGSLLARFCRSWNQRETIGVFTHFPTIFLSCKMDLHMFGARTQRRLCLLIQGWECLAVSHARKRTENMNFEGLPGGEFKDNEWPHL